MPLSTGIRLGRYEIQSALGAGGMGEVYRARDTRLKREVAIKVLPAAFASDPDRLARFEREAELLATLNHPNIGAVYGFEEAESIKAIVLELVEGPTLAEVIHGISAAESGQPSLHTAPSDREARQAAVVGPARRRSKQRVDTSKAEQPEAAKAQAAGVGPGPIPIDDALAIARQIADALEVAHEKGVVHRDLKPANLKITPEGHVKILDFGLAKLVDTGNALEAGRPALSMSPTLSVQATYAGVILGTAAYMSPEQARGKPVDRRTDIWAFGCVLYEMLTGRQAFETGETVSDAVAAVLTREPDWNALPAGVPAQIRRLLHRCLQKDPQRRLPHIGMARFEIDEAAAEPEPSASVPPQVARSKSIARRAIPAGAAAVVTGLLVGAAIWQLRPAPALPVTRFPLTLPEGRQFTTTNRHLLALSPDGALMAYVASGALNVRSMSELESRVVSGTENVSGIANPVFSPDGRWIAYWALGDLTLRKVAVAGGAPVTICQTASFLFFGMSWNDTGILYGQGGKGIMRVSPNGGLPEVVVAVKDGEVAHGPQLLPDGQHVLFTLASGSASDRWDKAQIVVHSLKTGERKTLITGGSDARYVPTGHLVYALRGSLFAVPFDVGRLETSGNGASILEGVRRSLGNVTGAAQFSTSGNGSLAYIAGPASASADQDLALIDAKGVAHPLKLPPGRQYEHPRISPDGKQVAFATDDGQEAIVWIYDLAGTSAMRRLTFGGRNRFPLWSADGQHVAFQSDREGDPGIYWQRADGAGAAERLTRAEPGTSHVPESWSFRDVLSFSVTKGNSDVSLWTFSLHDKKAGQVEGVRSSSLLNSAFSPDGKWIAYVLNGIYVQPFPGTGATYQIETIRGIYPQWSRNGREMFYTPPGQLLAVDIRTEPSLVIGKPRSMPRGFLVNGTGTPRSYDVTADGRFIGVVDSSIPLAGSTTPQINVVLNWTEELKRLVPTR
jgi:eukaryotic-like serine/threonine-protein kinase